MVPLALIGSCVYYQNEFPGGTLARFTLTDLTAKTEKVIEAALNGPVDIICGETLKFVMLTADEYDRLTTPGRRAFHVDDAASEVVALMLSALERPDD
jgi:antitoxin Phd